MVRKWLVLLTMCLGSSVAMAGVINVELKFTPFVGDPKTSKEVKSVAGKAQVYINNVLYADQDVREDTLPVMFEGEVAPTVWLPVASAGSVVRKGNNKIRIEFEPANASTPYTAQLRWASVMDEVKEESSDGQHRATNQADEGVDEKKGKGKIVMEREFVADFAADLPWHHYAPITALSDADRKDLAALLKSRVDLFKPKFDGIYAMLKDHPNIRLNEVKKMKCLDKAYAAGIRIVAPAADQVQLLTTGGPEVVIRRASGELFQPADPSKIDRIKNQDMQMCIGMSLFVAYPPRLIVARSPAGKWEVVR